MPDSYEMCGLTMVHPRTLLNDHGLFATKRRGQNYLVHTATAQAIAAAAKLEADDTVVEIGAGLGALTLALSPLVRQVMAVEVDRGIFKVLQQILDQAEASNVEPLAADALDLDWLDLAGRAARPLRVVGNLPYSVSSPLIFNLLDARAAWSSATLLLQRELVTRLGASPGNRDYGRLTVLATTWCSVQPGMVLGPEQFFPRPRVDSQLITLIPRDQPLGDLQPNETPWFARVVKAAFGQRRKTLANSLAGGLGRTKPQVTPALEQAGIDPKRRAETVSAEEFAALARELPQS